MLVRLLPLRSQRHYTQVIRLTGTIALKSQKSMISWNMLDAAFLYLVLPSWQVPQIRLVNSACALENMMRNVC
jgi:hypothetical protein